MLSKIVPALKKPLWLNGSVLLWNNFDKSVAMGAISRALKIGCCLYGGVRIWKSLDYMIKFSLTFPCASGLVFTMGGTILTRRLLRMYESMFGYSNDWVKLLAVVAQGSRLPYVLQSDSPSLQRIFFPEMLKTSIAKHQQIKWKDWAVTPYFIKSPGKL